MDRWMKLRGWSRRSAGVMVLFFVWVTASTSYSNEAPGKTADTPAAAGAADDQVSWKGEVSLGYNQSSGNSEQEQVLLSGEAVRTG